MRLGVQKRLQRGDTIVEVMFAVAVFAMVAVGSISIMNQGTAAAQRSLEVTLVREQIDAQAETIRYIHQVYIDSHKKGAPAPAQNTVAGQWVKMATTTPTNGGYSVRRAAAFGTVADGSGKQVCPQPFPTGAFALDPTKITIFPTSQLHLGSSNANIPPFAQVYDNGRDAAQPYGIWVQAVSTPPANGSVGFVDFHIRACWDTVGSNVPATLGTIVRLYEPL